MAGQMRAGCARDAVLSLELCAVRATPLESKCAVHLKLAHSNVNTFFLECARSGRRPATEEGMPWDEAAVKLCAPGRLCSAIGCHQPLHAGTSTLLAVPMELTLQPLRRFDCASRSFKQAMPHASGYCGDAHSTRAARPAERWRRRRGQPRQH